MSTLNAQVAIPPDHFRMVRQEYSDHITALCRELLQNSVDANATEINIVISDDNSTITFQDNGDGMDQDTLIRGLLTFSGSVKKDGAVGGFGQAKFLILFQHAGYTVRTRNISVRGKSLSYSLDTVEDTVEGTTIGITLTSDYLNVWDSKDHIVKKFRTYIQSCFLTGVRVVLNGEEVQGTVLFGDEIRMLVDNDAMPWARMRQVSLPKGVTSNYVLVRSGGLTMFQVALADAHPNQYIVELLTISTKTLNVNRDGLRWPYCDLVSKQIQLISLENESFGQFWGKVLIHPGKHRSDRWEAAAMEAVQEALAEMTHQQSAEDDQVEPSNSLDSSDITQEQREKIEADSRTRFAEVLRKTSLEQKISVEDHPGVVAYQDATAKLSAESGQILDTDAIQALVEKCLEQVANLNVDFVVQVIDKNIDKIPASLQPNTMGRKPRKIAKAWKHAIATALNARQTALGRTNPVNWRIGWALSHGTEAAKMTDERGIHTFLVNPIYIEKLGLNDESLWRKLLLVACHEVAHLDVSWHSEKFTMIFEELVLFAFAGTKWRTEMKAAKNLEL